MTIGINDIGDIKFAHISQINSDIGYIKKHSRTDDFAVVPSVVVHPLADQLDGRLCPVLFQCWHVQIVNEKDCVLSERRGVHPLPSLVQFAVDQILKIRNGYIECIRNFVPSRHTSGPGRRTTRHHHANLETGFRANMIERRNMIIDASQIGNILIRSAVAVGNTEVMAFFESTVRS